MVSRYKDRKKQFYEKYYLPYGEKRLKRGKQALTNVI